MSNILLLLVCMYVCVCVYGGTCVCIQICVCMRITHCDAFKILNPTTHNKKHFKHYHCLTVKKKRINMLYDSVLTQLSFVTKIP